MTPNNQVTLFSNGIGHFKRFYKISKESTSISLSFNKVHIGEVVSSLQVFGQVTYDFPPSFTPITSNTTNLKISSNDAFKGLVQNLSGAAIHIDKKDLTSYSGTLVGLATCIETIGDGETIYKDNLTVMDSSSFILNIPFNEILCVKFLDPIVQNEINKALKNSIQKINPESTVIEILLSSNSDKEEIATVQYTTPVAAWKMRYIITENKGKFVLYGDAIVDNNTYENWENFILSVVTGNPISFSTDISSVVVPQRSKINLIDVVAQKNVDFENKVTPCATPANTNFENYSKTVLGFTSQLGSASFEGTSDSEYLCESVDSGKIAESMDVTTEDVGDFCVFTTEKPISINSKTSAIIPMFNVELESARFFLFYREEDNSYRPFRTLEFKNSSPYSFGKGKITLYKDEVFSGESVLQSTKPDEIRKLPYCVENGVKVFFQQKKTDLQKSKVSISDGVIYEESIIYCRTFYKIENYKDENFDFVFEHPTIIFDKNVTVEVENLEATKIEKLIPHGKGYHISFNLKNNQILEFAVVEKAVRHQEIIIGDNLYYIENHIGLSKEALLENKEINSCFQIQKEIQETKDQIEIYNFQKKNTEEASVRLRKDIQSLNRVSSDFINQLNIWTNGLAENEKIISNLDNNLIPDLNKKLKDLNQKLLEEIKKIVIS